MKLIDKIDSLNSDDIKLVFKELIKDYFSPAFGSFRGSLVQMLDLVLELKIIKKIIEEVQIMNL